MKGQYRQRQRQRHMRATRTYYPAGCPSLGLISGEIFATTLLIIRDGFTGGCLKTALVSECRIFGLGQALRQLAIHWSKLPITER